MQNILLNGLEELGFSKTNAEKYSQKLENYIKELRLFNSEYNLVNTDDHDQIVIKHILDSLSTVKEITSLLQNKTSPIIADIGSGGGLPGIPLSIVLEEYNFVLIERMSKRCAFLENVAAVLGLKNVKVLNLEAEKVPPSYCDIAVFRAFRPLDKKMIKTLLNLIKDDGFLCAYKAKKENIIKEMSDINYQENEYKIIPLQVPYLTQDSKEETRERNLVLIRKE